MLMETRVLALSPGLMSPNSFFTLLMIHFSWTHMNSLSTFSGKLANTQSSVHLLFLLLQIAHRRCTPPFKTEKKIKESNIRKKVICLARIITHTHIQMINHLVFQILKTEGAIYNKQWESDLSCKNHHTHT